MSVKRGRSSEVERIMVLMEEIAILKTKLQPHDTGHIHTAINVLEERVEELQHELEIKLRGLQSG
ncbi:MAG: hypothetical protein CMO44_11355 [Verrucomicrobiales bacterium]|nr:hypothetical protein [Verrucomicrobiales bacterium]|tara:strand:- start:667 stop:861 length:195 start_codon:yes stop_codon:yes gene_type:complete